MAFNMGTTRRHFLQASTAAGLLTQTAAAQQTQFSANDKVQIGLIGAGIMGIGDCDYARRVPGVELVAVADVYDGRLTRAKEQWGSHVFTTRDYREVLRRPDVDAVIIATPDHWHAQISIDAMNAGKDVYVEKPMVQRIEEAYPLIETQKKTGRILQVGSQRVSSIVYEKAKQLLAAGAIGQLNMIEAWWDRNSAMGAWQYSIPLDASPATCDWDMFLGRAPKRPFDATRLFRWRNYQDYGTGVAGDLFVHLFSGMHYVTGSLGPTRVFGTGGLRFWKDGRDVPDVMLALCDYPASATVPAFNLMLRVNFVAGAGESSQFRFIGSEGVMTIGNGVTVQKTPRETEPGYTIDTFSKAQAEAFLKKYREQYPPRTVNADSLRPSAEERYLPPRGYDDHQEHHRIFIEAVRSRKPVIEDAVFGLRAAGPALLANVSHFSNRICEWDPVAMKLKNS
jgi:predicted dehydrogenase